MRSIYFICKVLTFGSVAVPCNYGASTSSSTYAVGLPRFDTITSLGLPTPSPPPLYDALPFIPFASISCAYFLSGISLLVHFPYIHSATPHLFRGTDGPGPQYTYFSTHCVINGV